MSTSSCRIALRAWTLDVRVVFGVSATQTALPSIPLLSGLVDVVALCVFGCLGARYLRRKVGLSLWRAMLLYVGSYLWLLFGVLGVDESLTWGVALDLLPQLVALLVGVSLSWGNGAAGLERQKCFRADRNK